MSHQPVRLPSEPSELRVRAVRLTKRTAEIVGYGARPGDWLLHLRGEYDGEFRLCSNKTFRRDFKKKSTHGN